VSKGLKPGETVVIDGQLRVVPGKPVEVKNAGSGTHIAKDSGPTPEPIIASDSAPKTP
jgi:hypothetical protein